ncbi:mitochondrial carrier domain-containing protein [Fimicolochytrium jonesii]|uniref:mitochondrial carrier domain-containing protein n=1 Tax=Fimicolochytrium jonesii TaxID=1396493 RepID=UPI0022FE6FBD|nr:mitochondrial carrier domain-containing protein [Fimicolochytrium jonesii]KAI8820427.1 mitochondrial carrier domain-containing protein [Fimicolochytrium jonesii]
MSDNVAHALAGMLCAGGGMVSMALTYPLTTLSTRSQVSKGGNRPSQADVLKKVLKEEGPKGLYSGINSAMFGIAITQYVYYYWYEFVKAALEKAADNRSLTIGENMLTGALAGAATATLTNPIWVVNTRQVVKKSDDESGKTVVKKLGTIQTAKKILREEGPKGFFQGILPALILVINPVIQFTVFERLKGYLQKRKPALSGLDFFILGAISKLAATSITYPYIVVKSRMQLKQSTDDNLRYKSVLDGFQKIIRTEGAKGLYKGIESKLLQSVLASAFTFAFKEEFFSTATWLLVLLRLRTGALPVGVAGTDK